MPCSAPNFSKNAKKSLKIAKLLRYAQNRLALPVTKIADQEYPKIEQVDELTIELCDLCSNMTYEQSESIIYARTKIARRLANWWEDHQEYDFEKLTKAEWIAKYGREYGE